MAVVDSSGRGPLVEDLLRQKEATSVWCQFVLRSERKRNRAKRGWTDGARGVTGWQDHETKTASRSPYARMVRWVGALQSFVARPWSKRPQPQREVTPPSHVTFV